ncbi:MAG TPA: hypothetical protein VGB04_06180 [Allosphingosinicella sp.]|jgi:hypothetical protein
MSAEEAAAPRLPRAHWIVWLFALVGLAGILAFVLIAMLVLTPSRRYQPAKVAGTKAEETFTVQSVRALPGTDLIQMQVGASSSSGSYSGSGGSDLRNILLLDRRTGASRRILPDNSRRIRESRFLPARADPGGAPSGDEALIGAAPGDATDPAAYYLLEVAQEGDRNVEDVLVGRLADGRQSVVMAGIDGVDLTWMDSPTRLGLIVREKLRLYYRIVDVPSLKVVESRPIAID